MPKNIVTALGLVVSLAVIALGVFLVAMPLYFQAVGVDTQTATVAQTNAIYQTQVDSLEQQKEDLDQTNANVAGLRSQIPATGQLDDVFEVVAKAATASEVALTSVTAADQVAFVTRTSAGTDQTAVAAPTPEPTPTDASTDSSATPPPAAPESAGAGTAGRQQVEFAITATALDMAQATAFLDALRAGPRLLSSITATTSGQGSEGTVNVQISALAYVDGEG